MKLLPIGQESGLRLGVSAAIKGASSCKTHKHKYKLHHTTRTICRTVPNFDSELKPNQNEIMMFVFMQHHYPFWTAPLYIYFFTE